MVGMLELLMGLNLAALRDAQKVGQRDAYLAGKKEHLMAVYWVEQKAATSAATMVPQMAD